MGHSDLKGGAIKRERERENLVDKIEHSDEDSKTAKSSKYEIKILLIHSFIHHINKPMLHSFSFHSPNQEQKFSLTFPGKSIHH